MVATWMVIAFVQYDIMTDIRDVDDASPFATSVEICMHTKTCRLLVLSTEDSLINRLRCVPSVNPWSVCECWCDAVYRWYCMMYVAWQLCMVTLCYTTLKECVRDTRMSHLGDCHWRSHVWVPFAEQLYAVATGCLYKWCRHTLLRCTSWWAAPYWSSLLLHVMSCRGSCSARWCVAWYHHCSQSLPTDRYHLTAHRVHVSPSKVATVSGASHWWSYVKNIGCLLN